MLAASEPQRKVPKRRATPAAAHPKQESDVRIAEVIARVVSDVPGVAGISPRNLAAAATYGPAQTVHGVVLHHRARGTLVVEVHVVAAEAVLRSMLASWRADHSAEPTAESTAVLPALAEEIRSRIARDTRGMALRAPTSVDVYFDDLV